MNAENKRASTSPKKKITLVIPAFNEEENLKELFQRVDTVIESLPQYEFEQILIDNDSHDATGRISLAKCESDSRWKYIKFSRNFSAEMSLAAGIKLASGDAVIFLFSDLQEPPELIPELIEKWEDGHDVAYGMLVERNDGHWLKALGSKIAYRAIYTLSDVKIPANATDYKLISRHVVDVLNECEERNRYLRGLIHWVGFKQVAVPYSRDKRVGGDSSVDMKFLLRYTGNAIVAFSSKPLELVTITGILILSLSLLGLLIYLTLLVGTSAGVLDFEPPPAGFTTIVFLLLFFGGLQSMFVGLIGQYVGNIYTEVKRRPAWVVEIQKGFEMETFKE